MEKLFKNKQLVFLENDCQCPASDDSISFAKQFLKHKLKITSTQISEMIIHYQYHNLDKDAIYEIIFNPENVIVTYSVYSQGSDAHFKSLMAATGRNDLQGLTYIDASGCLIDFLNRNIPSLEKNVYDIICGVNANNIISIDYDVSSDPKLVKIEPKFRFKDCVAFKSINEENIIINTKNILTPRVRK